MNTRASAPSRRRLSPRLVAAVVLGVLALVFIFQNTGSGHVNFLFWDIALPAWVWLLVIFLIGVVVGSMFPWFRRKGRD